MSSKGFILLTALPPTVGHLHLINWAEQYCLVSNVRHLVVLVCGQSHEPLDAKTRADILREHRKYYVRPTGVLVEILNVTQTMPQEPEEHVDFWAKWKTLINTYCHINPEDVVFASEKYGFQLAELFGCKFINCNVYREVVNVSATKIRQNPIENFYHILTPAQFIFRRTITIFGPESTGKTTLAKRLAHVLNGHFVPEWAREYLELQSSPETTLSRMQDIVYGQYASQEAVYIMRDKPFIFQDTDLLSTAGFYKMYNWDMKPALDLFIPADYYLLMGDNVPFTPDPLRYGGDKREAPTAFWKRLLDERKLPYTLIDATGYDERLQQAVEACRKVFMADSLWSYNRHAPNYNPYVEG